ncbi:MAG: SRPBCC domain-containing protein [Lewinella sp.]|nr:SRPBCC domain-containing protein [Lewinella sp.]
MSVPTTHPTTDYTIYHDLLIEASPAQVFAAVSQPGQLIHWWPLRCSGQPALGEAYNFYFGPEYDWYGEVVKYTPDQHFHVKMTESDADWDPTTFGFDLTPAAAGTQLQFWHRGWPACNAHYRRSSYCWAILLKGLKDYVEKGIITPFEERE